MEQKRKSNLVYPTSDGGAKVSARFKDESGLRWYDVDGKRHISVTQVLDYFPAPYLVKWFKNNTPAHLEKRKKETAQQGTEIHKKAHEGKEDRLNNLLTEMGAETVDSEVVVYSKHGWAGQLDRIIKHNGKLYVCDIKSGGFGSVHLQLSGYTLALKERGVNIEGNGVLSVPRDTSRPAKWFEYSAHMDANQYAWACLFDAWKNLNYKMLLNNEWPFFETKTVLQYNWEGPDEDSD